MEEFTADLFFAKLGRLLDRMTLPRFRLPTGRVLIQRPRRIVNPSRIIMGSNIRIGPNSVIAACRGFVSPVANTVYNPIIKIGNGVNATGSLQIYAVKSVIIEDFVLFASNVFIADYSHGFSKHDTPIVHQPYDEIEPVSIGAGSWLGQNVVVMPGVTVGRQCVIGANSVVTDSIPNGSVAVGAPARVIKSFDSNNMCWSKDVNER